MGFILSILSAPFSFTLDGLRSPIEEISYSSKTKEKLLYVMTMLPALAAILMLIYSIVTFVIGKGYTSQIDLIKTAGVISAFQKIWTSGTVLNFYQPWFVISISGVFVAINVIAIIEIFKTESIGAKIGCVLCLIISLLFGLPVILELVKDGIITRPLKKMIGLDPELAHIISIVLAVIAVVTAIIYFKILCETDYFVFAIINYIACFTVYPLVCFLIENIFGFVFAAIAVIAFLIIFSLGDVSLPSASSLGGGTSRAASTSKTDAKAENNKKLSAELNRLESERSKVSNNYKNAAKSNFSGSTGYYGASKQDFEKSLGKLGDEIDRIKGQMK